MPNNNKPIPLNLADVVKNPDKYDEQTKIKAITMITEGAEGLLSDLDREAIAAIKKAAEGSTVVDLEKIRNKIKNI